MAQIYGRLQIAGTNSDDNCESLRHHSRHYAHFRPSLRLTPNRPVTLKVRSGRKMQHYRIPIAVFTRYAACYPSEKPMPTKAARAIPGR